MKPLARLFAAYLERRRALHWSRHTLRAVGYHGQAFLDWLESRRGVHQIEELRPADLEAWHRHVTAQHSPRGLPLKARTINERGDIVEQFAFTDLTIGAKIEPDSMRPTYVGTTPGWRMQRSPPGDIETQDTGWTVGRLPSGFAKVTEGYRTLRDRQDPVAHLVFSDGLTSVSVFIEKSGATPRSLGPAQQGGISVYVRPLDDRIVTVLGEVPAVTVRQIANSVARR
jgi:sigma-E factor negative regulatory protein RseB